MYLVIAICILLIAPAPIWALNDSPAPWVRELCDSTAPALDVFTYITNRDDNTVSIIDTSTQMVIETLTVGESPRSITVTPDGRQVYVANHLGNSISVISAPDNNIRATVRVNPRPYAIAAHPDGSTVYVGHWGNRIMSAIDTETLSVSLMNIPAIRPPDEDQGLRGIVVHPDGDTIYVANRNTHELFVIDVATGSMTTAIPVGRVPFSIAIHPSGSAVYVGNNEDHSISVVDTATNRVIDEVRLGAGVDPRVIAF